MKTKIQEIDPLSATDFERAREIMGRNLISLSQIENHLGQHFNHSKSNSKFKQIPFSEELLRENAHNFVLIRGVPLSIEELYKKALINSYLFDIFSDGWFIREKFAVQEKVEPVWYFMQKRVNSLSLGKTYDEAESLLGSGEEVPRACELFYVVLLYYLITHKYLFRGFYPFSQDVFLGNHLLVGFFSEELDSPPNKL